MRLARQKRGVMAKSGVEHLAQHPGWKTTTKRKRTSGDAFTTYLDQSDVATILAALRLFQREYEDCESVHIADAWPMHFNVQSPGGEVGGQDVSDELVVVPEPLGSEDIDALCERINTARTLKLTK
jgi:hypothetical protein